MDFVREIPEECLTARECAGVWSGWNIVGDREVVREASAKGTHINLAHKYLAFRRHCTVTNAKKYFSDEVEIWVDELLKKQQIHRASHILKNSGRNALEYIKEKCVKCSEPRLRKYLADYVMTNDGFDAKYNESWTIMNSITLFEGKYGLELNLMRDRCISEVSLFPDNVKSALITELYFHTNQQYLSKTLKNTVLWDYLLSSNKTDLLVWWIVAYHRTSGATIDEGKVSSQTEVFRELEIDDDMLENIETSRATNPTKELVLNKLSRYGVFTKKERNDVKLTLARFFGDCATPAEFADILSHERRNFDRDDLTRKLFSILYYRNAFGATNTQGAESEDRNLLDCLTELCRSTNNDENVLQRGIVETVNRLSNDLERFCIDNPMIVMSLVFLEYSKNTRRRNGEPSMTAMAFDGKNIFNVENDLVTGAVVIPATIIAESLLNFPYLNRSLNENRRAKDVTIYQLLNGYKNLDVQELFAWRYKKEPMPNFTTENLISKYGGKEKLTYTYYLKEARPSMAAWVLHQQQSKMRDGFSSKIKYEAASYAHLFGLQHSNDPKIMCTCVSFIEMLSVDSECLRLQATAGNYVEKATNISIYGLLESVSSKNKRDLDAILSYMECTFQSSLKIDSEKDTSAFIEALKSWDFITSFARAHNSLLPCFFLKLLAINNLWFEFVLVGDIFAYPLDQIMENGRHFENPSIREHLLLALSNTHILTTNSHHNNSSKIKSRELFSMATRQSFVDQDASLDDSDLWLTIFKCHQSQDPPGALITASQLTKSPVLTVLAACYEPSAIPGYCYSWLVISVNVEQFAAEYEMCLTHQLWPNKKVSDLFRSILSFQFVETLSRGFQIFMPTNPLNAFFQFLVQCVNLGDFKRSPEKLQDFVNYCSTLNSNKIIDWESTGTDYLHNSYWIVTVAVDCMMIVLGKCFRSIHLQIKFLDVLVKSNINAVLNVNTPDFYTLWEITTILSNTKTSFNFSAIHVTEERSNVNAEIEKCIRDLVDADDFNSALKLSKLAGMNCSKIILAQYRCEFNRSTDNDSNVDTSFWQRCASDLRKYNVSFEDAAAFFVEHAEKVVSHKDRYEILKLALQTLVPIATDKQAIDTVEMAMWKSSILAGPDSIEIAERFGLFNVFRTELLSGVNNLRVSCVLNDTVEESAVEVLINRFITAEDLATALRISTIFNHKHRDLKILMLCLSLAEGEISPYQLTSQQKSLLSETGKVKQQKYTTLPNRGFRRRSSQSSHTPSPSHSVGLPSYGDSDASSNFKIQQIQLESLSLIEKLVNSLRNGLSIGTRILLCIKLATYLRRSYQSLLILDDPMQLLYEIVGSNCDHKLEMVGDIIAAYRINNDIVAKFLAEEIVANTPRLVEEGLEGIVVMWGYPLGVSIQVIIDLCNDPSLLGWELLKTANLSLGHSHGEKRNVLTLKVVVELLIRSHDCFTASCSMEGIASVLRKSQHLAYTLQQLKHWSILVRLVTGLRRFTEMNYIFQILMENDQFEFLLGQGLDKIPGLKTALLEFSKRHCSENKELFTMIALHFRLYNEIASMWEIEAKNGINELLTDVRKNIQKTYQNTQQAPLTLPRNETTEKKLQEAMKNYTHVTDYYLQDNKLNLASRFSHQAQLVALQICLLVGVEQNQRVACLFNLTPDEINKTMCQALSLPQTLILLQAYNHHGDWSAAVYVHVVINGEARYLKDFMVYNRLTSAIVQECVCRYRSEKVITKSMTENMQMLVSELTDVECKYVLASQLGLKKIIEKMLANPATSSYLKDTVWKQGFNMKEQMGDN